MDVVEVEKEVVHKEVDDSSYCGLYYRGEDPPLSNTSSTVILFQARERVAANIKSRAVRRRRVVF
jgi:hypothetical protein